jgi:ferric-dicitrate binding protein FerR (iron transport regulator)
MSRRRDRAARHSKAYHQLGRCDRPQPTSARRRLQTSSLVRALIAVACCGPLLSAGAARSQQQIGQIGAARIIVHDVSATRLSQPEPVPLAAGIPVVQNDVIDTKTESAAVLVFQDGTGIGIAPQSEIVLDRVVYNPPSPQVKLSLRQGVARFSSGNLPKTAYEIYTPSPAKVDVNGTVLTITVSPRGATTVSVAEGSATVTAAGQAVTVAAGQSTLVSRGAPPTPPVPTPPVPPIVIEMDRLLRTASLQNFGTRAAARSPAVEAPTDAGTNTFTPNVDGKIQSEIAGDATPAFGSNGTHASAGSNGTHASAGSRGTH